MEIEEHNEIQKLLYKKIDKRYKEEQRNHMESLVLLVPKHTFEVFDAYCAQVRYKDLIIMWSDEIHKMQIITKEEFNEKYNMSKIARLTISKITPK